MKTKIKRMISVFAATVLACSLTACGDKGDESVKTDGILTYNSSVEERLDFSSFDGTKTQYIKKFDQFSTTWGFVGDAPGYTRETSINQLEAVADMGAESMRFDLFMGYTGLGYGIGNTPDKNGTTDEEYGAAMQVINKLASLGVSPQMVLFACPAYAQSYGSWKSKPIAEKWQELCRNMATYFKQKDIRVGAYEIWNEPDLGNAYFDGDWQDYIDTYLAGVKGVKEGDPDAFVQAISASWIHNIVNNKAEDGRLTQWESFVKQAAENNAMPDSISWHFYGRGGQLEDIKGMSGDGENFSVYRNAILNALTASQGGTSANDTTVYDLSTLQQHLNEFNIYVPLHADSAQMWNSTQVVPGMFNAIETLLNANDITRVNWATFLSEQVNGIGCSAVDLYSLQRYPAYYTNWMYGRLPVRRIAQPTLSSGLKTLAGVDGSRAGFIIYNPTDADKSASVAFDNIPFDKGDIKVYLVDEDHYIYSTSNEPFIAEKYSNVNLGGLTASFSLKPNAVYYVEINKAGEESVLENSLYGNIVRKDYWYPQRGDNTPYSDIYERDFSAWLSMNNNDSGSSAVSVTLDGMSDKTLDISYNTFGNFVGGENSALGFKIYFQTESGAGKTVYWSFDGYSKDVVIPFGNKGVSDEAISLGSLGSGKVNVNLSSLAPDGWTGRINVSYVISNCGKGATATFKIA